MAVKTLCTMFLIMIAAPAHAQRAGSRDSP